MDAELKQRWVEALRSGEYQQGEENLHKQLPNGKDLYCCLGVLCDIEGVPAEEDGRYGDGSLAFTYEGAEFMLPISLKKRWGLEREIPNPSVSLNNKAREVEIAHHLAFMNDNGKSFDEIAEWIEANL